MTDLDVIPVIWGLLIIVLGGITVYKMGFIASPQLDILHGGEDCASSKDPFLKDLCYLDSIYAGYKTDAFPKRNLTLCSLIENPYLGNVCRRTHLRPHMTLFMTHRFTPITGSLPPVSPRCPYTDPYEERYCIYLTAAEKARVDPEGAMGLCRSVGDAAAQGECAFYIALADAMILNGTVPQDTDTINQLCEEIKSPPWRMECHYLLADQLARLRPPSIIPLDSIRDQCTKAENIASFFCFDHVASSRLPPEEAKKLCIMEEGGDKAGDCYNGLGKLFFSISGQNLSLAETMYGSVSPAYQDNCMNGVFYEVGQSASGDQLHIPEACNGRQNLTRFCYVGLIANIIGNKCTDTFTACSERCVSVFQGNAALCLSRLGTMGAGWFSGRNIDIAVKKCMSIPKELQQSCFEGLGISFGLFFLENNSDAQSMCSAFPPSFEDICFTSLGIGFGFAKPYNLSLAAGLCRLLPTERQPLCLEGVSRFSCHRNSAPFPAESHAPCEIPSYLT